jgi:hypothetical protein
MPMSRSHRKLDDALWHIADPTRSRGCSTGFVSVTQ